MEDVAGLNLMGETRLAALGGEIGFGLVGDDSLGVRVACLGGSGADFNDDPRACSFSVLEEFGGDVDA